jgi:hypothetical protein
MFQSSQRAARGAVLDGKPCVGIVIMVDQIGPISRAVVLGVYWMGLAVLTGVMSELWKVIDQSRARGTVRREAPLPGPPTGSDHAG